MPLRFHAPRIAWEATGLFDALLAEAAGDPARLDQWMRTGFPALRESLRRSGFHGSRCDEAATAVVESAYAWCRSGHAVEHECAWMAAVAANYAADEARTRRRLLAPPLSLSLSLSRRGGSFEPAAAVDEGLDASRRLAEAVLLLPPPYREAMAFELVEGAGRRSLLTLLQGWLGLQSEGARHVLRKGHGMLRFALEGGDPRLRWPRRYPPFLHIPRAWWTLPPGDLRLLCGGDPGGRAPRA